MKTRFLLACSTLALMLFAATAVEAASRTQRFRGSVNARFTQDLDKYQSRVSNVGRSRYFRYRSRRTGTRLSETRTTERRSNVGVRRRFGSSIRQPFASRANRVVQGRLNRDEFRTFSLRNIPVTISLPAGYRPADMDTLQWESGTARFENSRAVIWLTATDERCEGGFTNVEDCITTRANSLAAEIQRSFPDLTLKTNEKRTRSTDQTQLTADNYTQYIELDARDYRVGLFVFSNPVTKSIWTMRVDDKGRNSVILRNKRLLNQTFYSLFRAEKDETDAQRLTRLQSVQNRRNFSSRTVQRKTRVRFDDSQTKKYTATDVAFALELPNAFELLSDTLERNQGQMEFASDDSTFVLTATDKTCTDPTPRLLRRCMEAASAEFAKDAEAQYPSGFVLQNDNKLLQLTNLQGKVSRMQTSKNHPARLFVLRVTGKDAMRVGVFTFVEPIEGHVWRVDITAPEDRYAFLNDIRKIDKTFSSFFFERPE